MSSTEPEIPEYPLQRGNWKASARLSYQHHVYRNRLGYLIHPDIVSALTPITSPEPIQILDFATGNGIWAMEAASSFPKAHVTGLDVSAEQFPRKQTCPGNVTFATHNVFDDVPEEYLGKFDLVHVRFLLPGLYKPGSGDIAVRNLVRMVKTGGWLQWQETGWPMWCEVDRDGSAVVVREGMTIVQKVLENHAPFFRDLRWVNRLHEMMRGTGEMVDVKMIKPEMKKEVLRSETELILWSWEEGEAGLARMLSNEEQMEDLKNAMREEKERVNRGVLLTFMALVVVGRKS